MALLYLSLLFLHTHTAIDDDDDALILQSDRHFAIPNR